MNGKVHNTISIDEGVGRVDGLDGKMDMWEKLRGGRSRKGNIKGPCREERLGWGWRR